MMKDKAELCRRDLGAASIVALEYGDGCAPLAEHPSRCSKDLEIYDRIAFAGVGKYNELRNLGWRGSPRTSRATPTAAAT